MTLADNAAATVRGTVVRLNLAKSPFQSGPPWQRQPPPVWVDFDVYGEYTLQMNADEIENAIRRANNRNRSDWVIRLLVISFGSFMIALIGEPIFALIGAPSILRIVLGCIAISGGFAAFLIRNGTISWRQSDRKTRVAIRDAGLKRLAASRQLKFGWPELVNDGTNNWKVGDIKMGSHIFLDPTFLLPSEVVEILITGGLYVKENENSTRYLHRDWKPDNRIFVLTSASRRRS